MKVSNAGWLLDVRICPSPHFSARTSEIDAVIIHGISLPPEDFSSTQDIDALFLGKLDVHSNPAFKDLLGVKVSAHLLIDRQGELTQYVSFLQSAWHAGVSLLAGRESCNDFSIGIELQGSDHAPYTEAQYARLNQVLAVLKTTYPKIENTRIVGHADIAPGRKTDPGPYFDWRKLCLS